MKLTNETQNSTWRKMKIKLQYYQQRINCITDSLKIQFVHCQLFLIHPYRPPFKNNDIVTLKNHPKTCFIKEKADNDDIHTVIKYLNQFLLLFSIKMLMINRFFKTSYAIMMPSCRVAVGSDRKHHFWYPSENRRISDGFRNN